MSVPDMDETVRLHWEYAASVSCRKTVSNKQKLGLGASRDLNVED